MIVVGLQISSLHFFVSTDSLQKLCQTVPEANLQVFMKLESCKSVKRFYSGCKGNLQRDDDNILRNDHY